jgi:guanylate kinase
MLLTITGPSASGKTSLARALMTRVPAMTMLRSTTTRASRPSDLLGEYRYVDQAEFDRLIDEHAFLWIVEVHGNRYGTLKEDVRLATESGDIVLGILTVGATKELRGYLQTLGKEEELMSVYLDIADEELLLKRLMKRGDSREDIEMRINQCRTWAAERDASGVPYITYDASESSETLSEEVIARLKKEHRA